MNVSVNIAVEGRPDYIMTASPSALNAVLFDFNPSANPTVTAIKAMHAALISQLETIRSTGTPAQARCASIAITELEGTQMRAVKALFAK